MTPLPSNYANDAIAIFQDLQAAHRKACIAITARRAATLSLEQSKFGGLPFVPAGGAIPVNDEGQQLSLLAQINCGHLPENTLYPADGWLQFWYLEDELYGVDFDNRTAGTNHKVLYIPAGTPAEPEDVVRQMYQPYVSSGTHPLFADKHGVWGMELSFERYEQGITTEDGAFPGLFLPLWNKLHPEAAAEDLYDLPDEVFDALVDDDACAGPEVAHQIGGYPHFAQDDPRFDPEEPQLAVYSELLFQVDSQFGDDDWEICIGDAGVVNFFITPEALAARDFSMVLYTMDCS